MGAVVFSPHCALPLQQRQQQQQQQQKQQHPLPVFPCDVIVVDVRSLFALCVGFIEFRARAVCGQHAIVDALLYGLEWSSSAGPRMRRDQRHGRTVGHHIGHHIVDHRIGHRINRHRHPGQQSDRSRGKRENHFEIQCLYQHAPSQSTSGRGAKRPGWLNCKK